MEVTEAYFPKSNNLIAYWIVPGKMNTLYLFILPLVLVESFRGFRDFFSLKDTSGQIDSASYTMNHIIIDEDRWLKP